MNYLPEQIAEFTGGRLIAESDTYISHVSTDSRSVQNSGKTVFFALKTDKRDGHSYIPELINKGVKTFVVSSQFETKIKGLNVIQVSDTLKALQLFAANHRKQFAVPIIGITGSYGKTIVKEWLYQLLSPDYTICRSPKSFNSQLGVPLSVLLLENQHTLGIFEVGISEKGEMETLEKIVKPSLGVLTKMGEAHKSGFDDFEQKIREKRKLFVGCDTVIELDELSTELQLPFTDQASVENCILCIKVMIELGYTHSIIQQRINLLSPLALRLEMKKGKQHSVIINDGYNISYSSLVLSLEYLNQQAANSPKTLIFTDIPETSFEDEKLLALLENSELFQLIVIGGKRTIKLTGQTIIHHFDTTDEFINEIESYSFKEQYVLIKGKRSARLERVLPYLEEKNHRTELEVNLSQLKRNLSFYRKKITISTKVVAMVKAFSYGAGTVEIPKILEKEGVDYLGVAFTDEGIALRNAGIEMPIMVMNPEPGSFTELIRYELEPEIYSLEALNEFVTDLIVANRKEYPIHVNIETGMNRLGFLPTEIPALISFIKAQPEVYIKSVFSHLSSADDPLEKEYTMGQLAKFEEYSTYLISAFSYPIDRHILNTAGIENYNQHQYEMVRLGIGLYGINVSKETTEIKPISRLKSVVIQTKRLETGDSIGYGRKTKAKQPMTIAMIPIGYSDGLRRILGNGNYSFFVHEKPCPIVGNVCMDMCMIDVSGVEVEVGGEVEIFGHHNSIEDLANAMQTIPYEVLTSVSQRVKRVFYYE